MTYQYIKANKELKKGQRVQYKVTEYTAEGTKKSTEKARFTGKCEINSQGALLYELIADGVAGSVLLERNLFEVVNE